MRERLIQPQGWPKKLTFRQYQVLANLPEIQPTVMEQLSDRQFWHHGYDNAGLRSCFIRPSLHRNRRHLQARRARLRHGAVSFCRAGGHWRLALRHPITRAVRRAPSPSRSRPRIWLSGAAHRPDGSLEMQFAGLCLLHHAVKVTARRRSEMLGFFG